MKKFAKIFTCLALVLCMSVGLMGCVTGTYKNTTEIAGVKTVLSIELKGGDKCVYKTVITKDGKETKNEKQEGTYTIDGEKITFTFDKVPVEGTIKDGVINYLLVKYTK